MGVEVADTGSDMEVNGISTAVLLWITGEFNGDGTASELRELRELERGKDDPVLGRAGALASCTSGTVFTKFISVSVGGKKESLGSANGLKALFGSMANEWSEEKLGGV